MANYGGPDPYAFRELLNATRAKGDAVTDTIDKLGDIGAKVASAYVTKHRQQGIDVTDEALMAGLDWKGKKVDPETGESIGTRLKLWEAKRLGLDDRVKMLSLAKRRHEVKRLGDYNESKFLYDTIKRRSDGLNAKNYDIELDYSIYEGFESRGTSAFPAGSLMEASRLVEFRPPPALSRRDSPPPESSDAPSLLGWESRSSPALDDVGSRSNDFQLKLGSFYDQL